MTWTPQNSKEPQPICHGLRKTPPPTIIFKKRIIKNIEHKAIIFLVGVTLACSNTSERSETKSGFNIIISCRAQERNEDFLVGRA
mmetsp:Transcript_34811/g.39696  ORF Transcript_34811/g.39696 Transcript_34811/m.39696 type:complete len:85 (-) Transcript_34811:342-596(-)